MADVTVSTPKAVKRQTGRDVVNLILSNRYTLDKVMIRCHELRQSDARQVPVASWIFHETVPGTFPPVCLFWKFPIFEAVFGAATQKWKNAEILLRSLDHVLAHHEMKEMGDCDVNVSQALRLRRQNAFKFEAEKDDEDWEMVDASASGSECDERSWSEMGG